MTKITSVEKTIEYLRFAMREGCNCKGCEDDRANIGEHCVIRQALTAERTALLTELGAWADIRLQALCGIFPDYRSREDKAHIEILRGLKAYLNNLINPTST